LNIQSVKCPAPKIAKIALLGDPSSIVIMSMPQAGAQLFPRASSNVNDLERISTLRSIRDYVAAGLLSGYIARCDVGIPESASIPLVDQGLTLSEYW